MPLKKRPDETYQEFRAREAAAEAATAARKAERESVFRIKARESYEGYKYEILVPTAIVESKGEAARRLPYDGRTGRVFDYAERDTAGQSRPREACRELAEALAKRWQRVLDEQGVDACCVAVVNDTRRIDKAHERIGALRRVRNKALKVIGVANELLDDTRGILTNTIPPYPKELYEWAHDAAALARMELRAFVDTLHEDVGFVAVPLDDDALDEPHPEEIFAIQEA